MTTKSGTLKKSELVFEYDGSHLLMVKGGKPTREDIIAFSHRAALDKRPMDLSGLDLAGVKRLRGVDLAGALVHRLDLSMADIQDAQNLDKVCGLNEVKFLKTQVTVAQRDAIFRARPDIIVETPSTSIESHHQLIFVSSPELHTNGRTQACDVTDVLRK